MQKSRKDYSDEEDDRKSKKKSKKDYSDDEDDDRRSKKKKKKSSKKYDDESDEEYRSKKKSKRDDDSRSRSRVQCGMSKSASLGKSSDAHADHVSSIGLPS